MRRVFHEGQTPLPVQHPADERERANLGGREAWEVWNASMPPIPEDATVSLGYSVKDMPQR